MAVRKSPPLVLSFDDCMEEYKKLLQRNQLRSKDRVPTIETKIDKCK